MAMIHFLLIFLALSTSSVSADVFVHIDCGSSSDFYTDENSIMWIGDNYLIQNGESQVVQSSNSISHVMDTLRVFTTRKKNCYLIKVDKGGKILVRASFNYGNYDNKNSPPTFDLHFDGNYWDTVVTLSTGSVYYEAIYVAKGDEMSVCVAQTKAGQFPFMSALEVRSLESNMYGHVDAAYALFLKTRIAYGASDAVRYSDDIYDRIWVPAQVGTGSSLIKVTTDALLISVDQADYPPQAVLQNAITTSTPSQSIIFGTDFPTAQVPIYMTMYFSEVTELDSTQKRSFRVYRNNESFSDPILPPYANFTELYVSNFTSASNSTFSLMATADSTLPPLINAMELFYISDRLTDGTNSNDVAALASLQSDSDVLQEWGGDPCLPAPFTWDWLTCNTGTTPRITALYLSSYGLSGSFPDFSSMTALETIDLRNNSIYGPIPDFLGNLPNLKELNLADNQLTGSVPTSLLKNNKLKLVVTGNPDLCTSGKSCGTISDTPTTSTSYGGGGGYISPKKKSNKLPAILGSTIPTFIIFWVIVGVVAIFHHKRKTAAIAALSAGQNGGGNRPHGTPQGGTNNAGMAGKIVEAMVNQLNTNANANANTNANANANNDYVTVELADQMNSQETNADYNDRNA
ncbi:putative leucine-rich repeat receptor-like protein kinase At2g19210 [Actinidia eriantha]|uniref:putative leucine-rich repeat receptor-like protein kinase At2g19210 n=1 Tax=Actinidia eriantha TaxID=165200 RepID=UPI00258BA58B|nr:putative leucine-rich repeat receptor-like protein kinase At2g19210 [Actinidia eriantha]